MILELKQVQIPFLSRAFFCFLFELMFMNIFITGPIRGFMIKIGCFPKICTILEFLNYS